MCNLTKTFKKRYFLPLNVQKNAKITFFWVLMNPLLHIISFFGKNCIISRFVCDFLHKVSSLLSFFCAVVSTFFLFFYIDSRLIQAPFDVLTRSCFFAKQNENPRQKNSNRWIRLRNAFLSVIPIYVNISCP